jgi:hypothetical protein
MALDLDAVTRADAARRDARNASELIDLAESFYGSGENDGYLVSRGLTGTPENHNRVVRASENSFERMTRLGWSECVSRRNGVATVFRPNRRSLAKQGIESDAVQRRNEQLASRARAFARVEAHTELASGDC